MSINFQGTPEDTMDPKSSDFPGPLGSEMSKQFSRAFVKLIKPILLQTTEPHVETAHIQGYGLSTAILLKISSSNTTAVNPTTGSLNAIQNSRDAFDKILESGATIYGVNTGFGGSAGARTTNHKQLQVALIQMLNSASYTAASPNPQEPQNAEVDGWDFATADTNGQTMPIAWVRAAMLVRANTLLRGNSGVSKEVLIGIMELLNARITPVIPLRGSISASGDLSPLSYVVSTLQGNPMTMVYDHSDLDKIQIIRADEALQRINTSPLTFGPKEALAVVNGTAFSDAVGGLVVNDAMLLAVLSQMLTAMGVEAMCGQGSFDSYIAEVKNDDRQAEIARNIRGFLKRSKLAGGLDVIGINHTDVTSEGGNVDRGQKLAQDRYALRTSSQWLSPPTQDILLAFDQMQRGINSTTDNPIVDARDASNPRILNGGNFQGSATAGAMDKTRNALQLIGKLMFAQCTEIINLATNNGLPANLAATDPSIDFACKGLDINIAAYCSELGWLAHPIGPHVQSAEMHNQAVNSLALISARKTSEAISILQKMVASNLYILCQALDLRVMQEKFFSTTGSFLQRFAQGIGFSSKLATQLWAATRASWEQSGTFDLADRVEKAVASASPLLLSHLLDGKAAERERIGRWQEQARSSLAADYALVRDNHFATFADETPKYLSKHTAAMYTFIRTDLRVPMFQGLVDSPTRENGKMSIGGYVGVIESALKQRRIMEILGRAVRDVAEIDAVFPGEEEEEEEERASNGVH